MAVYQVIPPYLLESVAEEGDEKQKDWAHNVITESNSIRGARAPDAAPAADLEVYDSNGSGKLAGDPGVKRVVSTANPHEDTCDAAAEEAFDGARTTRAFYKAEYDRDSIDGNGMPIVSTVHYKKQFGNAFWNGAQMVYGDGDDWFFHRLTKSIDIIGHELTHGVVEHTAGLVYQDQSGALNESYADVFGSLIKQYAQGRRAREADWLLGEGIFLPTIRGEALRSLKAPGYAYDDPVIGKDPQPGHMDGYDPTRDDHGGVHINSGIPNRAFYLTAFALDGYAWERAGRIWYDSLAALGPNDDFSAARAATIQAAAGAEETDAVRSAWDAVGV